MKTRSNLFLLCLAAVATISACDDPAQPEVFTPTPLEIDIGDFPALPAFVDNPTTVEGVALGRRLFHDPALSGDGTQSCASCHQQALAFGDSGSFSLGILWVWWSKKILPSGYWVFKRDFLSFLFIELGIFLVD